MQLRRLLTQSGQILIGRSGFVLDNLSRIHDVIWIDSSLDRAHDPDSSGAMLRFEEMFFAFADPVFAGACALHGQASSDVISNKNFRFTAPRSFPFAGRLYP